MTTHNPAIGAGLRQDAPAKIFVTTGPPALSGPVLIGDVATPAGGQTLLALLLRAAESSPDE